MLKIYRGGFHVDLHGKLKEEIENRIRLGKTVYLVVPEMETLIAEEVAMREYPPEAPRFFEVTNFTRLANTVFRKKGGLATDSYDKTAKALLMWRALSEAMPLLSENTRSDITSGMVERSLRAMSEMEQLGLNKESLLSVADDARITENARLSGKLADLIHTLKFYGELLTEDGSLPSDLLRMAKMLREDASLFSDATFYFEGFTSFTEPQLHSCSPHPSHRGDGGTSSAKASIEQFRVYRNEKYRRGTQKSRHKARRYHKALCSRYQSYDKERGTSAFVEVFMGAECQI